MKVIIKFSFLSFMVGVRYWPFPGFDAREIEVALPFITISFTWRKEMEPEKKARVTE